MMFTNRNDFPLELAVWLAHDDYDYVKEGNSVSATGLIRPLRHIILPPRIPSSARTCPDVEDMIPTATGHAFHSSIERAWKNGNHVEALEKLGLPPAVIRRVLVNPTPEQLAAAESPIPIYVEQRATRDIAVQGQVFTVSGKFDMVCDGRLTDFKSTGVYTWIAGNNEDNYRLQGSIYRWLNPDKVTEDYIRINFIFTDWDKFEVLRKKEGYPPKRLMHKDIPLMSPRETEDWIRAKLSLVLTYQDSLEPEIPECSPEELWMTPPTYKYYSSAENAAKGGRSTKNFPDLASANYHAAEQAKGVVVTSPGTPRRCKNYCSAFTVCSQKDKYTHD